MERVVEAQSVPQRLHLLLRRFRSKHQAGGVAQHVRDEEHNDDQAEQDDERMQQAADQVTSDGVILLA
jgi:hypothetical protein